MGIVDDDVAAVRAASDIVAIISQYTQLRKVGRRFVGVCPFHTEKTPSFSVNAEEGLYYCFGCQVSGDVITFVREIEHLDFPAAVEWLAPKAGVSLRYTDRNEGEGRKRRSRLLEVMDRAVDWYHERLLSSPDAGTARKYLRERGLGGDVVREFRIGWAPESWDDLCRALRLDQKTAEETGLGRLNRRGRVQDHFRARVMFPICDDQGRPISFGGRILPGGERPGNQGKYQNTTETPLYNKSRVLYGLDRAKAPIVTAGTAVVCEGYTDVIGFHRSGVHLAVATCGTALTDDHVALLRRFAERFVLAFDADSAGQAAAERFYRWEREHDLEVAVADLPPGQDPGDLAQTDPERLHAAVEGARPFLRFRLDRVFTAATLTTPEGRAKAAEAALAVVAEHPDVFVRDQYLMDVGSRCRIDPERLRGELDRVREEVARGERSGGRSAGRSAGRSGGRSGSGRSSSRRPGGDGGRRGGGSGGGSGHDEPPPYGEPPGYDGPPPYGEAPPYGEPAGSQGQDRGPGGRGGRGGRDGRGGGRTGGRGTPARAPTTAGPALEVLRHAVHDPAAVGRWLDDTVFDDPVHAGVYRALVDSDTHTAAMESAPPPVAGLLARLLVEEPAPEPMEAIRRLFTEVARRELQARRLASATSDDPAQALADVTFLVIAIDDLRDPASTTEVADRLLAWLRQRVGDGG
jgi:DNA primase